MASLGSLVVSLTAETAQFRTSMERASRTAETNFKKIENLAKGAGIALAGYFTVTQTLGFIKGAIDAADALDDLSQRTGIATDELSKLIYAAQLSDVTQEQLSGAIQKLSRGMAEAAQGTGTANDAFKVMGVSIKDATGNLKTSDTVLRELADRFATYEDGVEKSALAQAIFGKSGAEMITFLNLGSKGLAEAGAEAERLGMVVFPDVAQRAGEFNDNLDKLKGSATGVAREIGNMLIPTLNKLMNEFMLVRKHGLGFFEVMDMGLRFGDYANQLRLINEELSGNSFFLSESRKASLLRQKAVIEEAMALQDLSKAQKDSNSANESAANKRRAPTLIKEKEKEKAVMDEASKIIESQIDAYNRLTMTELELAEASVFLAGGTMQQVQSMRELFIATQQLTQEQERARERTEAYVELAKEYKQLAQDSASPVQQLADEEARLEDLRKRLIENGYDVVDVENKIAEARMNAADKIMGVGEKTKDLEVTYKEFGSAIGTAFEDAILQGKGLGDVLKSLEQDIIRILMRKFVTQKLEGAVTSFAESMLGSFFGGARAMGGPVRWNTAYLVGERGPEVFVPNQSGSITPNMDLRPATGNQITVQNNFTISGPMDRRSQMQIAAATGQGIQRAMGRNT
jgi:uncharacterized phage infection (PIP) family protein YhgE